LIAAMSEDKVAASTIEGYRSAIAFNQRYRGKWLGPNGEQWARQEAAKGAGYRNKDGVPVDRGYVEDDMLQELIDIAPTPDIALACILCQRAALRWSQFVTLRKGDLRVHKEGSGTLLLHRDKRASSTNHEVTVGPDFVKAFGEAAKTVAEGELLFPVTRLPVVQLRNFIKESAKKLPWAAGLIYDGPHVFRHGHAVGLKRIIAATTGEALRSTPRNAQHYAREVESRKRQR
jgi:hypothetical protein